MRNTLFSLIATVSILVFSCSEKEPITSIKLNIASTESDKVDIFNIEEDLFYQLSQDSDSINLNLSEGVIVDLAYGWNHSYVYIKPGDNLSLDTLGIGQGLIGVIGEQSGENEYLMRFDKALANQANTGSIQILARYEVDSFLIKIKEKFAPLEQIVAEAEEDVSINDNVKEALALRLIALKGNDLMFYQPMYKYYNKMEPEIPKNFYAEIEKVNFTDPKLLAFEDGRQLADSWHYKDLKYEDYDSIDAYYAAITKSLKESYPNSLVGDFCYFNIVDNVINFGNGIDGATAMIDDFKANVKNEYLNTKLDETISPWLSLRSGLEAPDFVADTRDGEQVMLSELKGKRVYIDVWATWCGPCIQEIPALKALEKDLHEENIQFVSVSIDAQEDKEKWSKFIDDKELTGLQLLADGDWNSDVASAYNIKGIPRFLLIGEDGKIISANAPRPSDPKTKETLLN